MQLSSPAVEASSVRRARPLLGTRVEVVLSDSRGVRHLHAAVDEAFGCIERVQQLMSFQDADSDLSRLNDAALHHAHTVDAQTYRVCEAAIDFARCSDGAFDPTAAPDSCGRWYDIELCGDNRIRFHRPLRIDLSGIAKGYAVDCAIERLRRLQIDNALINAGGDMRALGYLPQFAHLRHPQSPLQIAHTLTLQDAALATSATYFSRRTDGMDEVSALIDTSTGHSYTGTRSVSVRAANCLSADALTKVVLFAPSAVAQACLAGHAAEAFVMDCA